MFVKKKNHVLIGFICIFIVIIIIAVFYSGKGRTDDDSNIVTDSHRASFPVDEIVLIFPGPYRGSEQSIAESIAAEVGGHVISCVVSANICAIKVPTENIKELNLLIEKIRKDLRIEKAIKNLRSNLF